MMDLETLRLFVDLAETKSFSRTAQRNFVSQSAVSQRVRALEIDLGQILVERGKGRPGASFTEAGQRLLIGARDLLARAETLRREMVDLSGEITGTLRVATVYSIGLHSLPATLSAFLANYPRVNVHLEYLRTDRIYASLLAGTIDLGIVACPQARPQIEVLPLPGEEMVLVLPLGHPLGARESVSLSDLQGLPFIAFDSDIPTRRMTDDMLRQQGVTVQIVQAFDNIETIKRVVEIGLGVAIIPEPTARREAREGTLIARSLSDVEFSRPTGVLLRKGRVRVGALSCFLNALIPPAPGGEGGASDSADEVPAKGERSPGPGDEIVTEEAGDISGEYAAGLLDRPAVTTV